MIRGISHGIKEEMITRSLFSNFLSLNDSLISKFVTQIPNTLSETVENITLKIERKQIFNNSVYDNRKKLKGIIQEFHSDADTLTDNIKKNIELLDNKNTHIQVILHQPNLFAYSGVFKKIVLLDAVKDKILEKKPGNKIINMFVFVDHDFLNNVWIRLAQLPSIKNTSGILDIRIPFNNNLKWKVVANLPIPKESILIRWREKIVTWIKRSTENLSPLKRLELLYNFEEFWNCIVEPSYKKSKSYADFNSYIISKIVNQSWKYDTLFVRLTQLSPILENSYKKLILNFEKYSGSIKNTEELFASNEITTGISPRSFLYSPLWLHCICGSKANTKIKTNEKSGEKLLTGKCIGCGKDLAVSIGFNDNIDKIKEHIHKLSPKAVPILLSLSNDLGITTIGSGTGGSVNYTIFSTKIFQAMSIDMPFIVIWSSKDSYEGFAQINSKNLLSGIEQNNISKYIENLEYKNRDYKNIIIPLLEQRTQIKKNNGSIDSLLNNLFKVKQEQRNVRQKIKSVQKAKNALSLNPCIIDYATNFGIEEIEKHWKNNLIMNDNLSKQVIIDKN